jgi:hypothetical protein
MKVFIVLIAASWIVGCSADGRDDEPSGATESTPAEESGSVGSSGSEPDPETSASSDEGGTTGAAGSESTSNASDDPGTTGGEDVTSTSSPASTESGADSGTGEVADCGIDVPCGEGYYCSFDAHDCGESGLGMCVPAKVACNLVYAPVCGCNGQTYDNECVANAAGVDIFADGPC